MANSQITPSTEIVTRKDAKAAGLKYYFTGKPCPHGHVAIRYIGGGCVPCERIRVRKQNGKKYSTDPEYRKKAIKQSRKRHQEIKSDPKRVAAVNAEARRRYRKRSTDAEWLRQERVKWRLLKRAYYENNPEAGKMHNQKRRTRLAGAEGRHTAEDISVIIAAQNYLCVYCEADLKTGYHLDHIMPLALGGSNWPSNLQCLCPRCNLSKGAKHPDDFAKEIGRPKKPP